MYMKQIRKENGYFMIEGSSAQYLTIEEAVKFIKKSRKAKKKGKAVDGRRFWSEELQMPFRSNWEITIAELMSQLGIKFDYEPERFYFRAERESYLPDFFLPEYNCWIEVKGYMDKRSEKRCRLFRKYHGKEFGYFLIMKDEMKLLENNPEMLFKLIEIATEAQIKMKEGG